MSSRKISSRLAARSVCWTDKPVTLPPGRDRLSTSPLATGSPAAAKTNISVSHRVYCSLRSRQVGLDVVVVTLSASAPPEDGMVQNIDLQHMSARRLGAAWRASY